MRTIILKVFAISAFTLAGCAGMQEITEEQRTITTVSDVPGLGRERIFAGTKIWIAENFRSAKAVLEYENKEDGTIIGNASIPYPCDGMSCLARGDWSVPFTIKVEMKDAKIRTTFSNIRVTYPPGQGLPAGNFPLKHQGDYETIKPALEALSGALVVALKKTSERPKDW